MSNNLEVALTKDLCLICTKEVDGSILINKRLTKPVANRVKELHGKVTGFAHEHCDSCKEDLEKAFMFIGYDEEKSDLDNLPQGFYRTGHIVGVKKDIPLVQEWVKEVNEASLKSGFIFIPLKVMKELGLIQ